MDQAKRAVLTLLFVGSQLFVSTTSSRECRALRRKHYCPEGCRTQPYIENGMVNYTNAMTYGSHATISCNENYVLRGDSFLECLNDGTWSGNAVCRDRCDVAINDTVYRGPGWDTDLWPHDICGDPDTNCNGKPKSPEGTCYGYVRLDLTDQQVGGNNGEGWTLWEVQWDCGDGGSFKTGGEYCEIQLAPSQLH